MAESESKYDRAVRELTEDADSPAAGVGGGPGVFTYATPADGFVVADLRRRLAQADDDRRVLMDLYERKLAEAQARARAYFDLLVALEAARDERGK